jgi:hypothetical protein
VRPLPAWRLSYTSVNDERRLWGADENLERAVKGKLYSGEGGRFPDTDLCLDWVDRIMTRVARKGLLGGRFGQEVLRRHRWAPETLLFYLLKR